MFIKDKISDKVVGEKISDNMVMDANGQLICENCILARTGYYDYLESELLDDGDDKKIVKVMRTPEEVFDPVSMKSMNFKPLVDDHPEDNVTPDTVTYLQKGFMTNVRRGTAADSDKLMADIVVVDPETIDLILSKKKRELSVGYTCDIDEDNGVYVMKNIRGNHIALCEAGRAGSAKIRDSRAVSAALPTWAKVGTKLKYMGETFNIKSVFTYPSGEHGVEFDSSKGGSYKDPISSIDFGIKKGEFKLMDVSIFDYAAKGSFNSLGELESHYKTSAKKSPKGVTVELPTGEKLEYHYLNGSKDKLIFIRKLADSEMSAADGNYLDVYDAKATKLKEGQKVEYKGVDAVVSSITPSLHQGTFFVEFESGRTVVGRHSFDEVDALISSGKIVIHDADDGVFEESNNERVGLNDEEVPRSLQGVGGAIWDIEKVTTTGGRTVFIATSDDLRTVQSLKAGTLSELRSKIGDISTAMSRDFQVGAMFSKGKTRHDASNPYYALTCHDTGDNMKSFRVSVGDKKFETIASSAEEALKKVRAHISDARPLVLKKGDAVVIEARGRKFTKTVDYVESNYGSPEDPNWYVDFTDGTNMKQKVDNATIVSVNGVAVKDSDSRKEGMFYTQRKGVFYVYIDFKCVGKFSSKSVARSVGYDLDGAIRFNANYESDVRNTDSEKRVYEVITLKEGETDSTFVLATSGSKASAAVRGKGKIIEVAEFTRARKPDIITD